MNVDYVEENNELSASSSETRAFPSTSEMFLPLQPVLANLGCDNDFSNDDIKIMKGAWVLARRSTIGEVCAILPQLQESQHRLVPIIIAGAVRIFFFHRSEYSEQVKYMSEHNPSEAMDKYTQVLCYFFTTDPDIWEGIFALVHSVYKQHIQRINSDMFMGNNNPLYPTMTKIWSNSCSDVSPLNRRIGMALFLFTVWNTKRHYLYPGREMITTRRAEQWLRKLDQSSPLWWAVRPFFIGGSSLSGLCGTTICKDDPADVRLPSRIVSDIRGETYAKQFKMDMKYVLDHGHMFEDMARQLYTRLIMAPDEKMTEIGMAIHPRNPYYAHSPDGIVTNAKGDPKRVIEIKCQILKPGCYERCPAIYMPQVIQACIVHNVRVVEFVSLYYGGQTNMPVAYCQFYCERIVLPHLDTRVDNLAPPEQHWFETYLNACMMRITGECKDPLPPYPGQKSGTDDPVPDESIWDNKNDFVRKQLKIKYALSKRNVNGEIEAIELDPKNIPIDTVFDKTTAAHWKAIALSTHPTNIARHQFIQV